MTAPPAALDLERRIRVLEDEAAIRRLLMTYGPAADAGLASLAGGLWLEDSTYDWDGNGTPHQGRAGVTAMLETDGHRGLVAEGVAHFAGPLMLRLDGDTAVALSYSLVMRCEQQRFYLWRVSAVRWDVERLDGSWRVGRRTNRLLDAAGEGSALFRRTLEELFAADAP